MEEVDRLLHVDPATLPMRGQYHLEIDFITFRDAHRVQQNYWLFTMNAVIKAGKIMAIRCCGATARDQRDALADTAGRGRQRVIAEATAT